MRIYRLYPGSFGSNCYLLISCDGSAAVVDPSPDADTILSALKEEQAVLSDILLTHGHFDHILSLDTLRDRTGVSAGIHLLDRDLPADADRNAFATFFRQSRTWRTPENTFSDGDKLAVGSETLTVLHTPGHTAGSCCFLLNGGQDLLTGDTLFANSYGRTDLWSGNAAELKKSLERLAELPPDTVIHPGHGGSATLGNALAAVRSIDI